MKGPNWSVVVRHCAISFLWRNIHCFYCRTLSPSKPAKVKTKFRIFAFFFAASAVFLGFCCAEFYHCGSRWKQNFHRSSLGGGVTKRFHTGRLRPEVRLLTLLYTIFGRKDTPFVYLSFTNGTPFVYLNEVPWMKGSCRYLHDRFPYPFIYFDSGNSYPFIYLKREKGTLFRRSLPV